MGSPLSHARFPFIIVCVYTQDSLSVSDSLDMLLMVHDKTNALATDLIDHCVEAEQAYLDDLKGLGNSHTGVSMDDPGDDDGEEGGGPAAMAAPVASKIMSPKGSRSQEALSSYVKAQVRNETLLHPLCAAPRPSHSYPIAFYYIQSIDSLLSYL